MPFVEEDMTKRATDIWMTIWVLGLALSVVSGLALATVTGAAGWLWLCVPIVVFL
jgi:hypothetical protein